MLYSWRSWPYRFRSKVRAPNRGFPAHLTSEFRVVCSMLIFYMVRVYAFSLRRPQALHNVLAPSGPRRHSGVSARLQLWHRPGGAARCQKVS
jgi:hypothetical protein